MSYDSRKHTLESVEIEDYGDDVSINDRSEQPQWGTIIFKVCVGLIFISFATGCIIYSILTSSEYTHTTTTNASNYYPYDISQHCNEGKLTWTNRTGSENDYYTITVGISWIQDATRRRLYHRIGIEEDDEDWEETYYVFSNHTFTVNKHGCERTQTGYYDFLKSYGLQNIRKLRVESFKIEDEYIKVNYYEGEPPHGTIIEGVHPAIIRGYSSVDQTFDYGWEYYFAQNNETTGLFKKEYWMPEMKAGQTDYAVFENIPDECYGHTE